MWNMGLHRVREVSQEVIDSIHDHYNFEITSQQLLNSYYSGVFEIGTNANASYILKIFNNPQIDHLRSQIEFSRCVKENITEFTTQEFVLDKHNEALNKVGDNYFYILKKHEIVNKTDVNKEEQQLIGRLMKTFHISLSSFRHIGIGSSSWMRELEPIHAVLLKQYIDEREYLPYVGKIDYQSLKLPVTLIHGDWHDQNMSFTSPPFLYDLDTLSYGSPSEEIARTITHWSVEKEKIKEFYDNLLIGYGTLTKSEIAVIPLVAVAICYKQSAEVEQNGNKKYAADFRELAKYIKDTFKV